MTNYKEKYLKYKNKYLALKSQLGGELDGCVPRMEGSEPIIRYESTEFRMTPNSHWDGVNDTVYNDFLETLDCINSKKENSSKVLVLNIGSSPIIDAGSEHTFLPDKSKMDEIIGRYPNGVISIGVDPLYPSAYSFSKCEKFNFKGYFPLTPGSEKANLILNKLINLNVGELVIINEVSSGCWNSFKAIMNNKPNTHYFANVNNSQNALKCGINMYGHKGTYNRCKRENPNIYKNEWINLKTLTTDGDDVEPLDNKEKIAALADEDKLNITFKLFNNTSFQEKVSKNITLGEIQDIILNSKHGYGSNIRAILIHGKAYFPNDDPELKLNEITTQKDIFVQVISPRFYGS